MLTLALSLKTRLLEILHRRTNGADVREAELLADVERSLLASRLLDEKKIPLSTWLRIEAEVRQRWINLPLSQTVRICTGCLFPFAEDENQETREKSRVLKTTR